MIALPRATSSDKPPVVISHHEINSSPYQVFGANDPHGFYGDCDFKLVSAGFTVVAPSIGPLRKAITIWNDRPTCGAPRSWGWNATSSIG